MYSQYPNTSYSKKGIPRQHIECNNLSVDGVNKYHGFNIYPIGVYTATGAQQNTNRIICDAADTVNGVASITITGCAVAEPLHFTATIYDPGNLLTSLAVVEITVQNVNTVTATLYKTLADVKSVYSISGVRINFMGVGVFNYN